MTPELGPGQRPGEIPPEEAPGGVEGEQGPEGDGEEASEVVLQSDAGDEADATSAVEEERHSTSDLAFETLLKDYFDDAGNLTTDLAGLEEAVAKEALGPNAETEEGAEIAKEVIKLVKEVIRIISPDLKRELDKSPETRAKVVAAFCEPVIKGHFTASDVKGLVNSIDVTRPPKGQEAAQGYKGMMHYSHRDRKVSFAPDSLSGSFEGVKLNFRHMTNHEVSHGLTPVVLAGENQETFEAQMTAEAPQFSSEMLKTTREIIDAAEAGSTAGYLSHHSVNTLSGLKDLDGDFSALSPERQVQYKSVENFKKARKVKAAVEIVTDYTAVYLQSDGTENSFYASCIDAAEKSAFDNFIGDSLDVPDGENKVQAAKQKLAELNQSLASGAETDESIKQKHPKLAEMKGTYSTFHKHIEAALRDKKGKVESMIDDGDDYFEDSMGGGSWDGVQGFADQSRPETANEALGLMAQTGELTQAFTEEVNLVDSAIK